MKLSERLLACAELVRPGNIAADIGTDHGHLPIYLLEHQICPKVLAADLREKPLSAARRNACEAGVQDRMEFYLSDGLCDVPLQEARTIICAGMGGNCIMDILSHTKAVWTPEYQFILQPQSVVGELRAFLGENGFQILREKLAQDGRFLYTVMEVSYGGGMPLGIGQRYRPQGQVQRDTPLYREYMKRVIGSLQQTVQGLKSAKQADPERLSYFETALKELGELEDEHDHGI
jgi:tRNA (adenine22-N1)-methyltransferase